MAEFHGNGTPDVPLLPTAAACDSRSDPCPHFRGLSRSQHSGMDHLHTPRHFPIIRLLVFASIWFRSAIIRFWWSGCIFSCDQRDLWIRLFQLYRRRAGTIHPALGHGSYAASLGLGISLLTGRRGILLGGSTLGGDVDVPRFVWLYDVPDARHSNVHCVSATQATVEFR